MAVDTADDLYGLPLDQFIPERGALARTLRDAGDREQTARVAKLRKPSVAAWAVNQLVRTQRREIAELFEAGDAAQHAQAELLEGRGDAGSLRDAAQGERVAVESLLEAARGLLSSGGHELSPTTLERVADTLHAAALNEDAREQVRHGRLERELRHVGMVAGGPGPVRVPAKAAKRERTQPGKAERRKAEPGKAEPGKAEPGKAERPRPEPKEAARARADAHRAARIAEGDARRRAERAARAMEVAEDRRGRAAQALEEAERAVTKARAELEEAGEAHKRAKAHLDET